MSLIINVDRPGKIRKQVSFLTAVEKDISRLQPCSAENLLAVDKSIHKIRKSLKSISSILLLYKDLSDQEQYLNWKTIIKSLSKQYGVVREPSVYLQTLNRIEKELKGFDNFDPYELRSHMESQYRWIVNGESGNELIRQGNVSIIEFTESLNNSNFNSEPKLLKRKLSVSIRKCKRLFMKLKLNSSADEFHEFRKWCKIYYFQQAALHRIGKGKTPKKNTKLYTLTEYLGREHDLQVFYQYLVTHFPVLSFTSESFFRLKIKKLRRKILGLYPKVNYL